MVQEVAAQKIAPHVEMRIRMLDQTVLAARRGIRNQLKSLLNFRKPASTSPLPSPSSRSANATGAEPGSPRQSGATHYSRTSQESQLRQLSDLALMVGDCETALTALRLLSSDYKSDKAYLQYAGVQEAMAIATVLCDGSPTDVVSSFREAYFRYDQIAAAPPGDRIGARYTMRTTMLLTMYLAGLRRYTDASYFATKAHLQEDNLRAALLLENAAHLLLRLKPPQTRKCAFHLVLAGLRYSQGGALGLASRAYSQALGAYDGKNWKILEEHVHEALGKSCRDTGDLAGAVEHFAATLLCPQVPAGLQSLHMTQFAEALKAATAQLVSSARI